MSRPLPGAWLQWIAERLCAPETCQRLLLPVVADLQFEWRQASTPTGRLAVRWRGSFAFARAFVPALVAGAVLHLKHHAWGASPEDRDATRRLLARMALATLAITLLLVLDQAPPLLRRGFIDVALLLPSMLAVALPAGCLLGAAWAAGGRPRWRGLLGVATLVGLVTFGVAGWLTPYANQAFRARVLARAAAGARAPTPGDRERSFVELGARRAALRAAGDTTRANREAVEWHKKPALAASCVALAVTGMVLAGLVGSRPLRMALALLVLGAQFGWLRLAERAADAGDLTPALAMWGGVALLAAGALVAAVKSRGGDGSIGA